MDIAGTTICPKCGFEQKIESAECPRCGIVFEKFKKALPPDRKETFCRSKALRFEPDRFHRFLRPLVVAKEYVEIVYAKILELILKELLRGENSLDNFNNLIAFAIFSLFSLVFYHLRDFDGLIFFALVSIWLLDNMAAKRSYRKTKTFDRIQLARGVEKDCVYERIDHRGKPVYDTDFNKTEIKLVSIERAFVKGGAFQEIVDEVWRVSLRFHNNFELLVFEEKTAARAAVNARILAGRFNTPVNFAGTRDERCFQNRASISQNELLIAARPGEFEIKTAWSFKLFFQFVGNVTKRSGFLLFILIMQGVMIRFGGLVNYYLAPRLGFEQPAPAIVRSFSDILGLLSPEWELADVAEYLVAFAAMAYSGVNMLKAKRIVIGKKSLQYQVGDKTVTSMKTPEIKRVLLYEKPSPMVLILGRRQAVKIDNARNPDELKAIYSSVKEGVRKISRELRMEHKKNKRP